MRVLRKILPVILILVLLYGGVLFVERMTTQELTSVSNSSTQETASLMWKPRLLRGDGVCYVSLLNSQGKAVDRASLGTLDSAFNALQRFGQLGFEGPDITVTDRRTGELVQRFVVHDGRLSQPK